MTRSMRRERGIALVTCVVMISVALAFTGIMLALALHQKTVAAHAIEKVRVNAAAEGATQVAVKQLMAAASSWAPVTAGYSANATVEGRAIGFTVTPMGGSYAKTVNGQAATCRQYLIVATDEAGAARTTVRRIVEVAASHAFQYAVLYDGDLEAFPAVTMTMSGPIHTNGNFYAGYNSGSGAFSFDTHSVRAAGTMHRVYKYNPSAWPTGTMRALDFGTSTYVTWPTSLDSGDSTFLEDIDDLFHGTVKSGAGGVTQIAMPPIQSTAAGGYYDTNAGLAIRDGQAFYGGSDVTAELTASGALSSATFYDAREVKYVTVTQIDVGLLGARFPANGLIYATRTTATPAQPDGIRIKGASTLPGSLTIASPNEVYLMGDFNTVAKKPAAVVCDAFGLLSNAWNDIRDPASPNPAIRMPPASNTTYNVAIVTGNTDTTLGNYNGGLESLPRFNENWTGRTCTITGSFACLWSSAISKGAWLPSGVYTPPTRIWTYDTTLATGTPPPFTPITVKVSNNTQWSD